MSTPPELVRFLALTREEQAAAIRDLASQGWSDRCIAGATRLSLEQVRKARRAAEQEAT